MQITDNDFLRQFEVKVNDGLAIIEYSVQERKIFLTKIIVPEMSNKDKFTEEFLSNVLTMISEKNVRVVPTASVITKFIRKNRKYKALLPVGIRI
ncbi:MAG: GNAT family N-acetyltransferase [Flavobacteriaceae bacterium]|nr:N-acetyltransferase [Flavobacteriaceae bacterium]|tara:strand:+ start:4002 stop:4286 length:285 start_codon:yes stop_codon:yes gene_type:complete